MLLLFGQQDNYKSGAASFFFTLFFLLNRTEHPLHTLSELMKFQNNFTFVVVISLLSKAQTMERERGGGESWKQIISNNKLREAAKVRALS